MTKEELRPIIIHEFKTSWTDSAEKVADRILAKIPDEIIIAEGKVIELIDKFVIENKNGNWDFATNSKDIDKLIGKNIRLKIEVLNES